MSAINRRTFVGASVAVGGAVTMITLVPGCSETADDSANTASSTESPVRLRINGADHDLTVDNRTSLLDLLREHIGLTGTKKGCDQGPAEHAQYWSATSAWSPA